MQVIWTDKKGAGRLACFGTVDKCAAFLNKLRRPAKVYDAERNIIGGCAEADGRHDDKRIKWIWWLESDAQ